MSASSAQQPDWPLVALLSASAVVGTLIGLVAAGRTRERTLGLVFVGVVVLVAGYTTWQVASA